jgi:hypothetical protein
LESSLTAEKLLQHKFFKQGKNSSYIVEHLLTQIPRPVLRLYRRISIPQYNNLGQQWNKEALLARSRAASISSLPKDGTELRPPAVTSWVFDDEELRKVKGADNNLPETSLQQERPPDLAMDSAAPSGVASTSPDARETSPASTPARRAEKGVPEKAEVKVGRFIVMDTDQSGPSKASAVASRPAESVAPSALEEPSPARVQTQGRFEVSDIEDDGNKDATMT